MTEQVGRYSIYDAVGTGGMATVHLARVTGPMGFSRTVAVKRLHGLAGADSAATVMFLDEARITSRIQHPFVVQMLDVAYEAGELLIVMEYVHGESLARLMRRVDERGEHVDIPVAVAIMSNVLHGLHAAHEATDTAGNALHLVHRDVSPHNVIVSVDGVAKVLDFGVAKALGRVQTTREGQLKGKLPYMSPEQLQAQPVDRRTDVFAASIVLWELLTGRRLFGGEDDRTTIGRLMHGDVRPPSELRPDVSPTLDEVVLRGLARDPESRWQTARDMALALEAAVALAPASRIAAFVEARCGAELGVRKERIKEIERSSGSLATAAIAARPEGGETKSAQGLSLADVALAEPAKRRSGLLGMGALALLVAVVVGTLRWGVLTKTQPLPPPATAATVQPVALPAPPEVASGAVKSEADAVPVTATTPGKPVAPARSAAPTVPIAPAPKTATPPRPDCTDPYVLDREGRKRYRRECLAE